MFAIAFKVVNDRRERAWISLGAHSFTNLLLRCTRCLSQSPPLMVPHVFLNIFGLFVSALLPRWFHGALQKVKVLFCFVTLCPPQRKEKVGGALARICLG